MLTHGKVLGRSMVSRRHQVPGSATTTDMIKRSKSARQRKWFFIGRAGGASETYMRGDRREASKQRKGFDPGHIGHSSQSGIIEYGVSRGGICRKKHIEQTAFSGTRDIDEMPKIHTSIRLSTRMTPGRQMMPRWPQKHSKLYLLANSLHRTSQITFVAWRLSALGLQRNIFIDGELIATSTNSMD